MICPRTSKFSLGQTLATPGALEVLEQAGQSSIEFLARHQSGDWGDVCPDDAAANDQALLDGGRILSSYQTAKRTKIWIITEADRTATTILLPEEY